MLHYSEHEDVIVMDSSAKSLASKLQGESLSPSSLRVFRGNIYSQPSWEPLLRAKIQVSPVLCGLRKPIISSGCAVSLIDGCRSKAGAACLSDGDKLPLEMWTPVLCRGAGEG